MKHLWCSPSSSNGFACMIILKHRRSIGSPRKRSQYTLSFACWNVVGESHSPKGNNWTSSGYFWDKRYCFFCGKVNYNEKGSSVKTSCTEHRWCKTKTSFRAVSKILSCLVITTSRWGIKQAGSSFTSIFFFYFPIKVAGENPPSPPPPLPFGSEWHSCLKCFCSGKKLLGIISWILFFCFKSSLSGTQS